MDELVEALDEFGKDVTNVSWSFFVWKHIDNIASKNNDVRDAINKNALSWRVITHSLQTTFFISLGRLFDSDDRSMTVETIIKKCKSNLEMFDHKALRNRKLSQTSDPNPSWLDQYIENAYIATSDDMDNLLAQSTEYKELYRCVYAPIRSKIMAHKDWSTISNVNDLFAKTNIAEIEYILNFTFQLENVLFDLLHNGKLQNIGDYDFSEETRVHADVESMLENLAKTGH